MTLGFVAGLLVAALVAAGVAAWKKRGASTRPDELDELRATVASLTRDRRRANAIVAAFPDSLLVVDRAGDIVELKIANDARTPSPLTRIEPRPLAAMFGEAAAAELRRAIDARDDRGARPVEFELRIRRELRQFESRVAHVDDGGTLLVLRDVTETKVTEAALQRARAIAEEAASARADLLARMSHDLRNPMTGVLGMTELMLLDESDPRRRNNLEIIQRSGDYLVAIVNDILAFSKAEQGKIALEPKPSDVEMLVADILELASGEAATKRLGLYLDVVPGTNVRRSVDATRFRQVISNLVANAIRYTDKGHVLVRMVARGEQLEVSVIDTGIGIPAEAHAAVFDAYVQHGSAGSRRAGGAGLGLAVCKQLVTLMDGTIELESAEAKGTCFRVIVPLAELPAEARPATAAPAASIRIAVRDEVGRTSLVHALERSGIQPTIVGEASRIDASGAGTIAVLGTESLEVDERRLAPELATRESLVILAPAYERRAAPVVDLPHRLLRHPLTLAHVAACFAPTQGTVGTSE